MIFSMSNRKSNLITTSMALLMFCILFVFMVGLSGCVSDSGKPTYKVLAGSELKDFEPELRKITDQAGYNLVINYYGSMDIAEKLVESNDVDALWVSHDKYLRSIPEYSSKLGSAEKIMFSKVVLGFKPEIAKKLNIDPKNFSWKELQGLAKSKQIELAMTNPTGSNTGFVTLVGVASAMSGKGDALEIQDIPKDKLTELFNSVSLTSGSSSWLMTRFLEPTSKANVIVNYENVIKQSMPDAVVVYPKEGVVTVDYPFIAVKSSTKTDLTKKITEHLLSDEVQKGLVVQSGRTPKTAQANAEFIEELPFPGSASVINTLIDLYLNEFTKPVHAYLVVDVSGSMSSSINTGSRTTTSIELLKEALKSLVQDSSKFAKIRTTETVTLIPFDNEVKQPMVFDFSKGSGMKTSFVQAVDTTIYPQGGTALYDALWVAQSMAQKDDNSASILLFTDGISNQGMDLDDYAKKLASSERKVPVYTILYGEGSKSALDSVAKLTNGKLFDAKSEQLNFVFKQIRSYQ